MEVDGSDLRDASLLTVTTALRGPQGSKATVGLDRAGHRVTVGIVRGDLVTDDVTVSRLRGGVEVVRVVAFTRGVGRQVRDALVDLPGGTGVVLDLRGDPGGLLTEAVEVAGAFLDGGVVVSYEKRGEPRRDLEALGSGVTTVPLVVLVDPGTASAAEVVAAALQDRNRAVVVGSRTYGKGSVQEPSTLSDGSALELTVGRYLTPSGRVIDGVGVAPDIAVDADRGASVAEQRAVEVLRGPGGRCRHLREGVTVAREKGRTLVAANKKARHEYHIEDTFEAGIVLSGTEVKSLRAGRASLVDGFATITRGEAWLHGVHIPEYTEGTWNNHAPRRIRKLLLHRKEIEKLERESREGGMTLVPLSLYFKDGYAKVELALAKGKKSYDKRQSLAERDSAREIARARGRAAKGMD